MRRKGSLLFVSVSLLLSAAAGCGSNQGCLEYARTLCARQIECSAVLGKYQSANLEQCQSIAAQNCQLATRSPDSNWTQDAATGCAHAMAAASCDVVLAGPRPKECLPPGTRALGATCADGFQCQSLYCSRPSARECGTCAPLAKEGEACGLTSPCQAGLQCAGTGQCAPLRNKDEVCDANFSCQPTLACSNGTCQPPTIGQSCAGVSDYCSTEALLTCSTGTLTCQPINYAVSKIGDSCGVDYLNGAYIDCEPGAYCKPGGSQTFGVCAALPREGQACAIVNSGSGTVYQLCQSPSTCISGTCQIFDRGSCK
jgi:hypothetical protein